MDKETERQCQQHVELHNCFDPTLDTVLIPQSLHSVLEKLTYSFSSWYDILVYEHLFVLQDETLLCEMSCICLRKS